MEQTGAGLPLVLVDGNRDERECTGCGRALRVKNGYCRLCWQLARYRPARRRPAAGAVSVLQGGVTPALHQLFFDRMQLRRPHGPVRQHEPPRRAGQAPPAPAAGAPAFRWIQPRLSEGRRDFTRFDENTAADLANPWLAWAPRRSSGPEMVKALQRAEQLAALGAGRVGVDDIPANRLQVLARTGLGEQGFGAGSAGRAEADRDAGRGGAAPGGGRGR